jgi:N-alpha-acetyltransferase 15/16, NatA auxiliary subunit
LKSAEQILKKNPNHADTEAMKALIIGTQGQTEAAFALAKTALGHNMKSHVCWHVYGLLYRAEKNFEESIKAYKFALRLEPESVPIQRDLAHLQIQMRDYEGYAQSRQAMLQQKPGIRQNWTALAIAHHLGGNFEQAENVLTTFEETLKTKPSRNDMEHWEAVLYKNIIIAESGQVEKALDHLDAVGKRSPDVLGVMELRADYLLRLKRQADAEAAYSALLDRNPENSAYYEGYIKAKDLKHDQVKELKATYSELSMRFPKSDLPRRRPLDFLQGEEFREAADAYLQRMLRKGVPSTFANIKHLYTDSSKRKIIEELAEGYASGKVSAQPNGSNGDKKDHFQSSVLYFLAQHYNYKLSRDLKKAMTYADKCIELDPKSVDFHAVKARTYKHQGDIAQAAKTMDQARALDEKDRAINTKCAKYQLRNDENDLALETASKFTQNKTSGGPLGDLLDMQCVWYLTEDGQSYLRQRKLALAFKRFHQILNIFDVWQDDQFDFHNFSLRKGMIRAYIDMLRWEDHLRDHPYYSRAAVSACEAYVLLHDNPDLVHGPLAANLNGVNGEELSAADRKKMLKKAKREQEKLEKAEADKRAAAKAAKPVPKSEQEDGKKEDTDPMGKTLLETKDPLGDAMKFLGPLLEYCPQVVEAQIVGFEIHRRRGKVLLAAKCLKTLQDLEPKHEKIPAFKAELKKMAEQEPKKDGAGPNVQRAVDVLRKEMSELLV